MMEQQPEKKPTTVSELLDDIIKTYASPQEAKQHWQDILTALKTKDRTCSRALINKRVRKLYAKGFWTPEGEKPALPLAQEPIIKVDQPETREILEEPKQKSTLPEPKPIIETEEPLKTGEEPRQAGELTEEEKAKLRPIMVRSIKRTFGVVTDGLLKLGEKAGITEQESDDCITLLEIGLVKWTGTALEKYYFETTAILHFGSLAGKVFIANREKKREEDAKREEEDRRKKAMEETPKEDPQKKLPEAKPEEKPKLTKEKPYSSPPAFLTGAIDQPSEVKNP